MRIIIPISVHEINSSTNMFRWAAVFAALDRGIGGIVLEHKDFACPRFGRVEAAASGKCARCIQKNNILIL
jgi:hypothetical protein